MGTNKSGVDPDKLSEKVAELESVKWTSSGVGADLYRFSLKSKGPCSESLMLFDQAAYRRHRQVMNDVFDATISYLRRIGDKLEKS